MATINSGTQRALKNPPCTAVRGCRKNAAILRYVLPNRRVCRICAMHYQRVKRTGDVGPAEKRWKGPGAKASREAVHGKRLASLLDRFGSGFLQHGKHPVPTSTVLAFKRRGWVTTRRFGPFLRVRFTEKGRKVMA